MGKNVLDELKIRISGLSGGLHDYQFSAEPAVIGLGEAFRKAVEVNAHLDKAARQIALKVEIRTVGHFQCDRCLDEFDQPVVTGYGMVYVYDEADSRRFPPEEVQVLDMNTTHLSLIDDVRQMVTLSIPLKLLCREDCKGLCPRCGTNWNHGTCECRAELSDPRWDGLRNIVKN